MMKFLFALWLVFVSGYSIAQNNLTAPIKLKSYTNTYFLTKEGNSVYSLCTKLEYGNDYSSNNYVKYIVSSPIGGEVSTEKRVELPKKHSEKPTLVSWVFKNDKLYCYAKYISKPTDVQVYLFEVSLNGKVKELAKVYSLEKPYEQNTLDLESNDKGLLLYYKVNKQIVYKTYSFKTNELSDEFKVFIPYLVNGFTVAFMENFDFFVLTYIHDILEVVTVHDGWVAKREIIGDNKFEPWYYNWYRDGDELYIMQFYQHINLSGLVGIAMSRFYTDKPNESKTHYFTEEEFKKLQVDDESNGYLAMEKNIKNKVRVTDNLIVGSSAVEKKYSFEEIRFYAFDKKSLELVNMDVILRKKSNTSEQTNYSLYVEDNIVKGFYFGYDSDIVASSMETIKSTLKKDKSGVLVDFQYDGKKIAQKAAGKQKIIAQADKCYDRDDYVAVLCMKGKSKGYWQIIKK